MAIENIIFDLCGPICDIEPRKIINTFKQYGVQNAEELFAELPQKEFLKDFEAGKISAEEFRNQIREITKTDLSDLIIDKAWNSCFVRLPKKHVELLGHLKLNYKVFLLSNSDEINYNYFKEIFEEQLGFDFFQLIFNDCFISCKTGIRKPSKESFLQITEKHQLSIEKTVFVDDSIKNIEGARAIGIRSHFLQNTEDIQDLFDDKFSIKGDLFE